MLKKLLKIYFHFTYEIPKDYLELYSVIIFPFITFLNLAIVSALFFSNNSIYSLNPDTYEIILITSPEQREIIGNQLVGFLFIGIGWIVVPGLKAIYSHKLSISTSVHMLFSSFGLYSILSKSVLPFALVIFFLIIRNTEISIRLSKIKQTQLFNKIYQKIFPPIHH